MACNEEMQKVENTLEPRKNSKAQEDVILNPTSNKKELRTLSSFGPHDNKEDSIVNQTYSRTDKLDVIISETNGTQQPSGILEGTSISSTLSNPPSKVSNRNTKTENAISSPSSTIQKTEPVVDVQSISDKKSESQIDVSTSNLIKEGPEVPNTIPQNKSESSITIPEHDKKTESEFNSPDHKSKSEQPISPKMDAEEKSEQLVEVNGILQNSKGEPVVEISSSHLSKENNSISINDNRNEKNLNTITPSSRINSKDNEAIESVNKHNEKQQKNIATNLKSLSKNLEELQTDIDHDEKDLQEIPTTAVTSKKSEDIINTDHREGKKGDIIIDPPTTIDEKSDVELTSSYEHQSKESISTENSNINFTGTHFEKSENNVSVSPFHDSKDEYTFDEVLAEVLNNLKQKQSTEYSEKTVRKEDIGKNNSYDFEIDEKRHIKIDNRDVIDSHKLNPTIDERTEVEYNETETSNGFDSTSPEYNISKHRDTLDNRLPVKSPTSVQQNSTYTPSENVSIDDTTRDYLQRKNYKNPKQEMIIFSDKVQEPTGQTYFKPINATSDNQSLEPVDITPEETSESMNDYHNIPTEYSEAVTPSSLSKKVSDSNMNILGADGIKRGEETSDDSGLLYNSEFKPGFDALNLMPPRAGLLDIVSKGLTTFDILPKIPIPQTSSFNDTLLRILGRESFTTLARFVYSRIHNSALLGTKISSSNIKDEKNPSGAIDPEKINLNIQSNIFDAAINAIPNLMDDAGNLISDALGLKSNETFRLTRGLPNYMREKQIYSSASHVFKDFNSYHLAIRSYIINYLSTREPVIMNEIDKDQAKINELKQIQMVLEQKISLGALSQGEQEELKSVNSRIWGLDQLIKRLENEQDYIRKNLQRFLIELQPPMEYGRYLTDNERASAMAKSDKFWQIEANRGSTGPLSAESVAKNSQYPDISDPTINWRQNAANTKPIGATDFNDGWLTKATALEDAKSKQLEANKEHEIYKDVDQVTNDQFDFMYLIINSDKYGKIYTNDFYKIPDDEDKQITQIELPNDLKDVYNEQFTFDSNPMYKSYDGETISDTPEFNDPHLTTALTTTIPNHYRAKDIFLKKLIETEDNKYNIYTYNKYSDYPDEYNNYIIGTRDFSANITEDKKYSFIKVSQDQYISFYGTGDSAIVTTGPNDTASQIIYDKTETKSENYLEMVERLKQNSVVEQNLSKDRFAASLGNDVVFVTDPTKDGNNNPIITDTPTTIFDHLQKGVERYIPGEDEYIPPLKLKDDFYSENSDEYTWKETGEINNALLKLTQNRIKLITSISETPSSDGDVFDVINRAIKELTNFDSKKQLSVIDLNSPETLRDQINQLTNQKIVKKALEIVGTDDNELSSMDENKPIIVNHLVTKKNRKKIQRSEVGQILVMKTYASNSADLWEIPFQFNPELTGESRSASWNAVTAFGRTLDFQVWANTSTRQIQFKTTYAITNGTPNKKNNLAAENTTHEQEVGWASIWTESYIIAVLNKYRGLLLPFTSGDSPPILQIQFGNYFNTARSGARRTIEKARWVATEYDISPNLDAGYTPSLNPRIYEVTLSLKEVLESWGDYQNTAIMHESKLF